MCSVCVVYVVYVGGKGNVVVSMGGYRGGMGSERVFGPVPLNNPSLHAAKPL